MVHLRAAKIAGIANDIPPATVAGDEDAELLIVGWGSTWARHRRRGRSGPGGAVARWRGPT